MSCENGRFEGTASQLLILFLAEDCSTLKMKTAEDCSTLKMKTARSSVTSVLTRPKRPHIPEHGIFHSGETSSPRTWRGCINFREGKLN
jgi:hypothetical protein